MKLIDRIKMVFVRLPQPRVIFITDKMVDKYRSLCNYSVDDTLSVKKRIVRMVSLAPYVYTYKNKKVYCFFDMKIETHINAQTEYVTNIWRDRRNGYYPIDDLLKKKWAEVYDIKDNSKEIEEVKQIKQQMKNTK